MGRFSAVFYLIVLSECDGVPANQVGHLIAARARVAPFCCCGSSCCYGLCRCCLLALSVVGVVAVALLQMSEGPSSVDAMFEIPENLPLRLGPLAWLLGRWQGWGTLVKPEDTPDEPIIQQVDAEILGEQMKMTVSVYRGVMEGDFDPLWDANQGLDQITAGDLLWEETLYWSVVSPLALVQAGGEEPRELRLTSASSRGYSILWAGVAVGPRIRLDSDAIARAPEAEPVDHVSRMFGLVGGELMWASENMVGDSDFEVEFTGRLQRVSVGKDDGEDD